MTCITYKYTFYFTRFFHSLGNIISVLQASFTAFEIANCHVIYLSTNYLFINLNKCRKQSMMFSSIEFSQYFDEFSYWLLASLL